jgi:hypothetical protein
MERLATDFVPAAVAKIQSEHGGIAFYSGVGGIEAVPDEVRKSKVIETVVGEVAAGPCHVDDKTLK